MLQTYDPLLLVFAGTGIVLVVHLLKIRRTVLNKRRLISDVTSLGTQPRDLLDRAWTGEDYLALDGKLCEWARQIREIARRHATAPWLHEFDGAGPSSSQPLSVAIAIVDDTLSVLMSVVPAEERPAQSVLLSLRGAINELTKTLPKAGIAAGLTVPSRPLLPERLESRLPVSRGGTDRTLCRPPAPAPCLGQLRQCEMVRRPARSRHRIWEWRKVRVFRSHRQDLDPARWNAGVGWLITSRSAIVPKAKSERSKGALSPADSPITVAPASEHTDK